MGQVSTKERLIRAASEIFAEKGFHETTVADICEKAGANIAAVNYHFGDKANLNFEVWSYLRKLEATFNPIPENHEDVGPETWLRLFIRSKLEAIFSEGELCLLPRIICRQMNEHTAENEKLFETFLRPNLIKVTHAVRDLLGDEFSEEQVELAATSYMGIHIFMNVGHQRHKDSPKHHRKLPASLNEQLIQQVEDFAIGGLNALKKETHP